MKNYMVQAILCTLLLFIPTGIAAIYYSAKVNPALRIGDMAEALRASSKAKTFCWISLGVGALFWFLWFLYLTAIIVAAFSGSSSTVG